MSQIETTPPPDDTPAAAESTPREQAVIRNAAEVVQILKGVALEHTPVVAHLRDHALFVSRLRVIDPQRGLVFDRCDEEPVNEILLSTKAVVLQSHHRLGFVEFPGLAPSKVTLEGKPALRFRFPDYLMLRQRRTQQRIQLPSQTPLQCIADEGGFLAFDALVMDISLTGLGAMIYDQDIQLLPGTILRGCRINHTRGAIVGLDIEVLYSDPVVLPDGRSACRSGCRFVNLSLEQEQQLQVMLLDAEHAGGVVR